MKKILVIGSGGREHALAKAFARSEHVERVYVAPGNAGMMIDTSLPIQCVPIKVEAIEKLRLFAQEQAIDLTFVGPEVPLTLGIVDIFRKAGLVIIGPTKVASQLESSKSFAKDLMKRAAVPTARYQTFTKEQMDDALAFLQHLTAPYVIKQDGLAAGKGVVIAHTLLEAESVAREFLNISSIVIEEYLDGEEFSFFTLVNEEHLLPIGHARDYKRVGDGDTGLNTGGMGAFSPVPFVDDQLSQRVLDEIVSPLVKQMVKEGIPYTGVLYAGLMLTKEGPKVIEFNVRFGDPETQILLPRIQTDFYEVCQAHLAKQEMEIQLSPQKALGVILAAEGYPEKYEKGMSLQIKAPLETICFSGVSASETELTSDGGRILMVTAMAHTLSEARKQVYEDLTKITAPSTFYRHDIGEGFSE